MENGQLYGTVFSGDNTVNYLHKVITVDSARDLPVSLGSDDGIKVYLNGKQILSNNIGRGAAPDQEKLNLNLKKGENFLLLKIHNGAGPSGFYFKADSQAKPLPSIATELPLPKGSVSVEISVKAKEKRKARIFWKDKKANHFDAKRSSPEVMIDPSDDWKTYRFDFVSAEDLTGLRFQPGGEVFVKSIRVYRNEAPVKLSFENALATFSQNGYPVASAVDGKIASERNGWAISPQMGKDHFASFQTKQDTDFEGGAELTFTLKQEFNSGQHALGRFRLAITDAPRPVSFGLPSEVKAIFAVSADKRTLSKKKLSDSFKNANPERIKLANALTEARKPLPADPQIKQLQESWTGKKNLFLSEIARLRRAQIEQGQLAKKRIVGAQDWLGRSSTRRIFI